jgi:exopolysaccharide biosynthesis WecB/TagA/CpsF family protein
MFKDKADIFSLFGLGIHNVDMHSALDKVMRKVEKTQTVCFVNVNTFNLAREHQSLNDAVNDADWVFADGSGVRMAAKRQGISLKDNVNGTDLLPLLCSRAAEEQAGLYFLGASPGVADTAAKKLQEKYPGLIISGAHHGFFDKDHSDEVIKEINGSGARILLVAFGSPIQEQWLKQNRHLLRVDTALAVGGLFDFFSGRISRAPLWFRKRGLEWVWRLLMEPRNKFHRYVIGNPKFLWRCFWQLEKVS